MKSFSEETITFALSLGSTHTSLVAASLLENQNSDCFETFLTAQKKTSRLHILGATRVSNHGAVKKGFVSSIEALASSIREAADEVEQQTGLEIENVRTCITSTTAQFDNHIETTAIKNEEIRAIDVERIFNAMRNQRQKNGYEYIHAVPEICRIDGKKGVLNPIGMQGSQLSVTFHRVGFPQTDLHNVIKSCNRAGLRVESFISEALAASQSVLTQEERELGCISISIGAYLTHVVVYLNNFPVCSKSYPLGSHHITRDLSIGLRTTQAEAERIKKEFGRAVATHSEKNERELIDIHSVEGNALRPTTKQEILHIIEPRVREILETVQTDLKKTHLLTRTPKGIILSGGGSLLSGMAIATERIFGLQTRIGLPLYLSGSIEGLRSPAWAAAVGSFSSFFHVFPDKKTFNHENNSFNSSSLTSKLWQKIKEPFASR